MKNKFNIENILCFFIIICPILDITSFLFRNTFNTKISISTVIRPIIPVVLMIYLFFKNDKKFKLKFIIVGLIYFAYAVIHIFLFSKIKTGSSYSNEVHEAQYLINYSFMILNLFIYIYVFKNINAEKLRKSVLWANVIYIISIYISIITGTSVPTYYNDIIMDNSAPIYTERMGYRGWFESANSISAILTLSMFIYLPLIKDKKYKFFVIPLILGVGIYLTTLIGTRVRTIWIFPCSRYIFYNRSNI